MRGQPQCVGRCVCLWGAMSLVRVGYFGLSMKCRSTSCSPGSGSTWLRFWRTAYCRSSVPRLSSSCASNASAANGKRRRPRTNSPALPNRRSITATARALQCCAPRRTGRGVCGGGHRHRSFQVHQRPLWTRWGDAALKHLARVLENACRGPNMAGRQGGEEFVVLLTLPMRPRPPLRRNASAVQSRPHHAPLASKPLPMTASIGVSVMTASDADYDSLLKRADQALYKAKQDGRNRVELRKDS